MIPNFVRCPKCFDHPFVTEDLVSPAEVEGLTCSSCNTPFASFLGVPVLCAFDHTDAQTVVETLALKQVLAGRAASGSVPKSEAGLFQLMLDRWNGAPQTDGEAAPWWLVHRQCELILGQAMLHGLSVNGALTLDVGAGLGTDSMFYAGCGARVVALEPNIALLAQGIVVHPELTWIGGSADALPVADETIDLVTANASLHHHLNVETSLDEMLRVLKPGGYLLTVADSVKGSLAAESYDVDQLQWDEHPAVLSGINEQVLRLDVLMNRVETYGDAVEGEVFLRLGENAHFVRWTFAEARKVIEQRPRIWGIMGMRVRKLRSIQAVEHRMRSGNVATPDLARAVLEVEDPAVGFRLLSELMSEEDLRQDVPLTEVNRVLQLSGWRWPLPTAEWRLIYRRGRLFMKPAADDQSLETEFLVPAVDATATAEVRLLINGHVLAQEEVLRGQVQRWSCPVELPTTPCSVTLELVAPAEAPGAGRVSPPWHIAVRKLRFSAETAMGRSCLGLANRVSLSALIATEADLHELDCHFWAGGAVESALEAAGALRRHGIKLRLHADAGVQPYYAGLFEQSTGPTASDLPSFFAGMSSADALGLVQTHQLRRAWLWDGGCLRSLTVADPFGQQLDPPMAPGEAELRRQLQKAKERQAALEEKLLAAKDRLNRMKQAAKEERPKSIWRRLRGK